MTLRSFGFGLELVTPDKVRKKAAEVDGYLRFLNESMVQDAARLGNEFFAEWTAFLNEWQTFYASEIQTARLFLRTMGARLTRVEEYEETGRQWQNARDVRLTANPPTTKPPVPVSVPPVTTRPPPVVTRPPPVTTRPPPTGTSPPTVIPPTTTPPPVSVPPSGPGLGTALAVGGVFGVLLLLARARR